MANDTQSSQNLEACDPQLYYNGNSSQTILPCGLIAWSLFNDTYNVRARAGRRAPGAAQMTTDD